MRQKIIVGNWKMNKDLFELIVFFQDFKNKQKCIFRSNCVFGLAVPFINLTAAINENAPRLVMVAQDVSQHHEGAYTGEVSAKMLKSHKIKYVIVGHSERRMYHNETDEIVNAKATRALERNITPIVCVGETLEEYEAGKSEEVVHDQLIGSLANLDLSKVIIAYEPIWAIGTGKTATVEYAQKMCAFIRSVTSEETLIQYGGSVNAQNIHELLNQPDIDGALVGGASLNADTFVKLTLE